ncbi:invasion associated locus B family protein [Bartonella krasnovii]|uniref:invasion associated locus B family protein n=1 Tax=Bartonella krasnovii TaxID=2267275 RepID=UPI001F4CE815|nr:invasion associated locus B family protein [Bartonella krasnovii]UNF41471.1 invasion associated locus B family protein [Bartonella krasnovii]UNF52970.1 invasion associated locus B family protein [Bartonella krasnovii]
MFEKTVIAASVIVLVTGGVACAQTPSRLNQFEAWGTYSYKSSQNTICYVLSVPLNALPTTVNHGDNFFLVTKRSQSPVSFEPQFMAGYTLKEGSKVTVTIGGKDFDFFTKDSSAWLASSEQEKQLVSAMRAGNNMTVKAISKRGTHTTYTYSLKGVTAALNTAQKCH